jgi:hypothetical protein
MSDDFFAGLDETQEELSKRRGSAAEVESRWRVLYEISTLFNSPVYTYDEILEQILDRAVQITGADRGLLLLYDERDRLEVKLARGIDMSSLPKEEREV